MANSTAERKQEVRDQRQISSVPHMSREKQDELIEEAKEHVRSNKKVYEDLAS